MVRKAREGVKKLGEGFRPELRKTYKDRRGGREVIAREKSGGVPQKLKQKGGGDGDVPDEEEWEEEWEEGCDGGVRL